MRRDNIENLAFDPDHFPVAVLEDELVGIGLLAGRRARANGTPEAAALWELAPDGSPVAYAEPTR